MEHEMKEYFGHEWQNAGTMRIRFTEGRTDGTRAILAENGCGLSLIILEDRCLDIYSLKVNGVNVPFLSKCGPVHPKYYDANEWEWLRSFGVGFLTTCGLTQAGEPCRYNHAEWGLHGPISNIPAENVTIENTDTAITIRGRVRQYKFQTEDMLLERIITIKKDCNKIAISDTVTNEGWKEQPFMLLYHYNFGYPLLNQNSALQLPEAEIEGWDDYSASIQDRHLEMAGPDMNYREQTFIHKLKQKGGQACFALADNREHPELSVVCNYNCENLPYITQWKHYKPGEYVMAIEPCNNHVKGAKWEAENGTLCTLAPGEKRLTHFTFSFFTENIRLDEFFNG